MGKTFMIIRFLFCLLLLALNLAWTAPRPKIVVGGLTPQRLADLKASAPDATIVGVDSAEAAMKEIADADSLIGIVNRELVQAGKKLRWVQTSSAGVERYRFPEMIDSDIVLTNCKILQGPEIADHAMALLLALTRRLNHIIPEQHKQEWTRDQFTSDETKPIELTDRRALIIGLGGIGTQIAQRAHAFGMKVVAVDPKDIPMTYFVEAVYKPDRLHELLPQADVVFSSVPHTPESEGMLGDAEFRMMKKGAYFINVSRGKIYDNRALAKALDSRHLAGAGVDVTDPEPLPKGHPLWTVPNVIITPHMAGQSHKSWDRRMAVYKENVQRFIKGQPMLNVVDKQKGY